MRARERPVVLILRLTVLTAAALLPLVFYLKAYEVFEMAKSLALRLFGALAVALLVARGGTFTSRSLPAGLLFLASCLLSALHSPLLGATGERLMEIGSTLALLWAVESGAAPVGKLLAASIWSQTLVTTYAASQYLGWDAIVWTSFGEKRVYATMGNPDFLAAQSSFLIPIVACLIAGLADRGFREGLAHWRARLEAEGPVPVVLASLGRAAHAMVLFAGLACAAPLVLIGIIALASPTLDAMGEGTRMDLFALAAVGIFFFAVAMFLRVSRAGVRGLLGMALALMLPSMLYTAARGAYLGFVAAIHVVVWLADRWVLRRSVWQTLRRLATLDLVLALFLTFTPPGQRLASRFVQIAVDPVKNSDLQVRLFYWYSGWLMGRGEPTRPGETGVLLPIGAGLGTFHLSGARAQGRAQQIWNIKWPRSAEVVSPHLELYAHNDYVHLFAELGPIGLGLYLWIMVVLLWAGYRALRTLPDGDRFRRWAMIGLLAATASWYVNSAMNFPLKVVSNAHLFFAVIVAALLGASPLPARSFSLPANPAATGVALLVALLVGERGAAKLAASHDLKIGHQLTQQNAAAQAADYFSRAAALRPIHTDGILVHYYRGKALQNLGRYADAEASYTRALTVFSNFPEGYQARGMTRLTVAYGARDVREPGAAAALTGALVDLRESLYLNPKDGLTCFSLGTALRLNGEAAASIRPFHDAILYSLDRIPDAHYGLALSLAETGDRVQARAVLESAMKKFSTSMPPGAAPALAALKAGRMPKPR